MKFKIYSGLFFDAEKRECAYSFKILAAANRGGVLTYYNLSTETKDLIKKVADEHAEFRSKIIKVNKLKGIT